MQTLANAAARRLFLARHGLAGPLKPRLTQAGLGGMVRDLGFVQVDSISTVERAHHMILFARNHTYRQRQLTRLHEREAAVFENWTHDAALIPTAFYPHWLRVFERRKAHLHGRFHRYHGPAFQERLQHVRQAIAVGGPRMARDFDDKPDPESEKWGWNWHPSKAALEYLWRTGGLAVARREGFQKVYDLPERVIPGHADMAPVSDAELVDWACEAALDRLGFATPAELAAFWDVITLAEAKAWCAAQPSNALIAVGLEGAAPDARPRTVYLRPETLDALADLPGAPGALRVLSPFDPAIRDRRRALHLFGFDYRIEIFVPAAKRRYGYYVFPLLEGDRFIGRIDMKCDRAAGALDVQALWLEPRLRLTPARRRKLEQALAEVAAFAGVDTLRFADGFLRD
ncbi:MAG: YcaQ family DNA glycosylase [Alphaproteobacteria bacterium]|nr:YcaQ family DNA glycosylase [Alphaproteobacteria bacterium]